MKCPFCKEEIENSTKVCPICGENIPVITSLIEIIKNIKLNKKTLIIIGSIIAIILFILTGVLVTKKINLIRHNPYYGKIVEHESIDAQYSTWKSLEAIELLNSQTLDLEKLLKKINFKTRKDSVFATYYKNLTYYLLIVGYNTSDDTHVWNSKFQQGRMDIIDGITFKPTTEKSEYSDDLFTTDLEIVTPKAPYIRFICDTGTFYPVTNQNYIESTYAKYLSKSWKSYLAIQSQIEKELKNRALYNDGAITIAPEKIVDWVVALQNFSKKYPDFYMKKEINDDIKLYSRAVIYSLYTTFVYPDYKLTAEAKLGYDKFLEKTDKEASVYKEVETAYNIIKKHDFKSSQEFFEYYDSLYE